MLDKQLDMTNTMDMIYIYIYIYIYINKTMWLTVDDVKWAISDIVINPLLDYTFIKLYIIKYMY